MQEKNGIHAMKLKFKFREYHDVALTHFKIKPLNYELVVQVGKGTWSEILSCQPLGSDHSTHGWNTLKIKKL